MITYPLPWYSPTQGGYLTMQNNILRVEYRESGSEQLELIGRSHPSHIYPVYDSLNVLSSCAWSINKRVLDLIIDVFKRGGDEKLKVPRPSTAGPQMPTLNK